MSRGSGWVRKELGRQGQSAQGLMGWILFWKQWMFESYVGSVWVFGKHNMPLASDSGFTGRVQALNQIPGRGFARPPLCLLSPWLHPQLPLSPRLLPCGHTASAILHPRVAGL